MQNLPGNFSAKYGQEGNFSQLLGAKVYMKLLIIFGVILAKFTTSKTLLVNRAALPHHTMSIADIRTLTVQ
jgi:hypothetical protein